MALWAGSSYATNVLALAFNHVIPGTTAIVRKKNGLLYHILGKKERGSTPFGGPKFSGMQIVSGVKHEITLLGAIPTISTVTAGANEYAAATMNYASNTFGAAEFALAHFADNAAIPESEWDKIKGGDQKQVENFVKQKSEAVMLGWEATLGTAINAAAAPTATTVGGWPWAVSDAQTTAPVDESAYSAYGTLTRASDNSDFRGYVNRGTGTLTLAKIAGVRNQVVVNGGMPTLGVCNATVYGLVEQLVQGQAIISNAPDMVEFGGLYFGYNGIKFILDKYVGYDINGTADQLGLLTPEAWTFVMNEKGYNVEVHAPGDARYLQASGHLHLSAWCSLICRAPSWNGKLVGITG